MHPNITLVQALVEQGYAPSFIAAAQMVADPTRAAMYERLLGL